MAQEAMEYDVQMQLDHNALGQLAPAELVSSLLRQPLLQPAPANVVSSQEGLLLLRGAPGEVVSGQEGLLLLQGAPGEVVNGQEGLLLLPAAPAEVVSSQERPHLLQPAPAEVVNSQGEPHLLQPAPQVSIDLTEEVEEENVENINPGTSEEHRQGSDANPTIQVASLNSVSSFINGLQRLHGMLEFLRPPSDYSVGPVRARRRRGIASRRARTGGSQRTDSAR